jgi:hypothetical protein
MRSIVAFVSAAAMCAAGACGGDSPADRSGTDPSSSIDGSSIDGSSIDGSSIDGSTRTVLRIPGSEPGDVISLRPGRPTDDGRPTVEWIDRREGTIRSVAVPSEGEATIDDVVTLARVAVGTDGEQRGLLGHAVIDGVRYAAWTDPDTDDLYVGEVQRPDAPDGFFGRIVWNAGGTAGGAVGGHLEATADGALILGIGQLTDWAKDHGSGALLRLDPTGPPDQEPEVLSDGYVNPFAFVVDGERLWVADNAVGDDAERIGSIDLAPGSDRTDRSDLDETGTDPRAPSAIVTLADGDVAVCGFLDTRLRRWSPAAFGDDLGPCLTGAVVLADGTIVTATADGLVSVDP